MHSAVRLQNSANKPLIKGEGLMAIDPEGDNCAVKTSRGYSQ